MGRSPGARAERPGMDATRAVTSLTAPATPLIGREDEIERVVALVTDPAVRIVTITGPGGAGKTRLSLAVIERAAALVRLEVAGRDSEQARDLVRRRVAWLRNPKNETANAQETIAVMISRMYARPARRQFRSRLDGPERLPKRPHHFARA